MILLGFTVRNHHSLRDEVTLDLLNPKLKTLKPADGDWIKTSYRAAAIYGANASGKTALLDAIRYATDAIRNSATTWHQLPAVPRNPFRIDRDSRNRPSYFQFEFILDDRRYLYGFEIDDAGIVREWLRDVPNSRWRTLFTRDRETDTLKFHKDAGKGFRVTATELMLSRAVLESDEILGKIGATLLSGIDVYQIGSVMRSEQLAKITEAVDNQQLTEEEIAQLLSVADTSVTDVYRHHRAGDRSQSNLSFKHRGMEEVNESSGDLFWLEDESDGTIAFLALSAAVLSTIRDGRILVVDEIDTSLHPQLLDMLLWIFTDEDFNRKGAQIVFTTHDPYLLSPFSDTELVPEQIWLTEKSAEGVTELINLAEYPKHPDANLALRYMGGRYGGTPRLAPYTFASLVS